MKLFLLLLFEISGELNQLLSRREASIFLTSHRQKRNNALRGEEGSIFNHDDSMERECELKISGQGQNVKT